MNRSIVSLLGLGTLFVMQLGGSCASDTSVSYHEEHPVYHEPARVYREPERVYVEPPPPREEVHVYEQRPPERVYVEPAPPVERERVYVEHGHDRDLPRGIPSGFYVVEDKEGKIRWTAPDTGTFYVYDTGKDFVRYSG